jgi:hypothetical protein
MIPVGSQSGCKKCAGQTDSLEAKKKRREEAKKKRREEAKRLTNP